MRGGETGSLSKSGLQGAAEPIAALPDFVPAVGAARPGRRCLGRAGARRRNSRTCQDGPDGRGRGFWSSTISCRVARRARTKVGWHFVVAGGRREFGVGPGETAAKPTSWA